MESQEQIAVTVSQLQREFVTLAGRAVAALVPIFIYALVQLWRFGNQSDYLLLLVGSILSAAAIIGYIITELTYGVKKQKSWIAMSLTFGGFIPWAFGSYLVFVDGFWSLRELADGFSIIIILKAMAFIFLGYIVVSKFYKITETGRHVSNNVFIVKDE